MDMNLGKALVVGGLVLVVFGALLWAKPGILSWFGRLPGDIRWEKGNSVVWIPITSMLLASLALTVLLNLLMRK